MMSENELTDFFFWLGADGESYELSKEEFDYQVEKARVKREQWLNVETEEQNVGG
jgi:hypothetical protein